jgi:hypothetical protein
MTPDEARALTDAQTLIYGGGISLTTAILVVLLQTLFQERRERYLERRATRERFSAYDLEKLKEVEKLLVECRKDAHRGIIPEATFARLDEVLILVAPNPQTQTVLFDNFWYKLKPLMIEVAEVHNEIKKKNPTATVYGLMGSARYGFIVGKLESAIVDFVRIFRIEALGEEPSKTGVPWLSRLRGRGGSG